MAANKVSELQACPLNLSEQEVKLRKEWLGFHQADEEAIQEIDPLLEKNVDRIMADVYDHFLSFEETKSFFPDEATLNRASTAQKNYFRRLTKGNYDAKYVQDRLRVGSTHHQIDLDPKWYLGAYNRVLSWIMELLIDEYKSDPKKLIRAGSAIRKLIFFDMSLAMETYIAAKEASIRRHRDALAELEAERRATKNLLESAPLGIVELDTQFCCLEFNAEFLKILDLSHREEALGKPLFELAPNLLRRPFEEALNEGQSYRAFAELLHFSPHRLDLPTYWDWATWPMKDSAGNTTGVIAKFSSATDRVLLAQQREDFVATLTHDLKTPILAANRAVKLLLQGDFGSINESQSRILETIHDSNEAMYKLVQTLLDVYRYDSGAKRLNVSTYNLVDTISKMLGELKPLAQVKEINLIANLPQKPVHVVGDEEEIRRVVQNLIDNSLKFTPVGGTITIGVKQTDKETIISVNDNGKGIPEEDMPKLFQRFWQAASSGRYYASTGLGLYLCRKIVELHEGRIWCDSKVGQGSTFAFSISNAVSIAGSNST